jgi:hypothetical protein
MAGSVTGVNKLTRLLSGSRNRMERFPRALWWLLPRLDVGVLAGR